MMIPLLLGWGARNIRQMDWTAPQGATVADALKALQLEFPDFEWNEDTWHLAVWGHPQTIAYVLKPSDRVEVLRGLRVDPKVARRERFQQQGSRAAGLFAHRRQGAKPGY